MYDLKHFYFLFPRLMKSLSQSNFSRRGLELVSYDNVVITPVVRFRSFDHEV